MSTQGTRLFAVLAAISVTLVSGTIQAYASLCQPAEKTTQEACCPGEGQGMQTENCTMDGCDCTISSKPTQQEDAPAVIPANAPTWDVPVTADSERLPSFQDEPPRSENVLISRDQGPPKELHYSANGLRAPPSQRA